MLLQSYKIKDSTIRGKCASDAWKMGTIYLLYKNYIDEAVAIPRINNDDTEISLRIQILEKYEITGLESDYILVADVETELATAKNNIQIELESMGVIKKKSAKRDETRLKMCYFGIKLIIVEEDEEEN